MGKGNLIINVYADSIAQPVKGAKIILSGENYLKEFYTDESGKSPVIELLAPEKEHSLSPQDKIRPYSVYDLKVIKDGLQTINITGIEILTGETSIQNVYMASEYAKEIPEVVVNLPEHGLWGDYPPKIPEAPIKNENGIMVNQMRVLSRVLVPEYVIVHDGIPTSTSPATHIVSFPDYIKNVASSEIYSTWPVETIKANVHAIVSFTLNRIFTEWYRSKGFAFTITSTPQYDQKYVHNRTIFKSISDVVDNVFTSYIRISNFTQPFLAQYNDGIKTNNPGWLSQWGSKTLGDQGYKAIDILKHYYTSSLTLQTAEEIEGLPTSFPGYNLRLNSCGEPVQRLQNMLNKISGNYPGIPKISPSDGQFKENTKKSVETFQKVFDLTVDGIVGFTTWYKVVYIYVAVSRMLQGV